MKQTYLFPPNYKKIRQAFPVSGRQRLLFCYGDTIHNPGKIKIPPQLVAHEQVHMRQQGENPENWWDRYIADPQFRLDQEIPAHVAEYRYMHKPGGNNDKTLRAIAERLSGPLYNNLISFERAWGILIDGVPAAPT